jgi:hypothetical protein
MGGDRRLGQDGCASDEVLTTYVRRGDRLVALCWGSEREADPTAEAEELDRMAAVNRDMAELCRGQGLSLGDYPARAEAQARAAAAIRAAFGLEAPAAAPAAGDGRAGG